MSRARKSVTKPESIKSGGPAECQAAADTEPRNDEPANWPQGMFDEQTGPRQASRPRRRLMFERTRKGGPDA
jgi:hypothetical protein